jgi:spore coat polysaccharide biosynthesis protein SpsF
MKQFTTEQEKFWAGEFGNQYIERNKDFTNNIPLFAHILSRTTKVSSALEFGASIGLNIKVIQLLIPKIELSAIEINETAVNKLKEIMGIKIYHQSILDFIPDYPRDFVLTKGVLIHLSPEYLEKVYDLLYFSSKKYICIAEYYNPTPVAVEYRGHQNKLFKRDFAGEILEKYQDLKLIDYGFVYHRDSNFPQDDITWFLLQKS